MIRVFAHLNTPKLGPGSSEEAPPRGTREEEDKSAAEYLWLRPEQVKFELGDTRFPRAPSQGGSQMTSSVGSAVYGAALAVGARLLALANRDADSPLLYDIVVDPAHRGEGVGRVLLDATLKALKAKGAPRVVLSTAVRNESARRGSVTPAPAQAPHF